MRPHYFRFAVLIVLGFLFSFNWAENQPSNFEGFIFPLRQASLSTLGQGVVNQLPQKEGEKVAKGTLLVGMDAVSDSLQLLLARRDWDRGKISQESEVEKRVAFQLKELKLKDKLLYAPFDGTLIKVYAVLHEYYSPGAKMVDLADLSELSTEIQVPLTLLPRLIKSKTKIWIEREGKKIPGQLLSYSPVAEPGVELVPVKIRFPNPHDWLPGTAITVGF